MANLIQYDPLNDTLENLFEGFFRPVRIQGEPQLQIKMDMSEDDKAYTIKAEIPGVKKEDITVSIEGNLVTVSAELKEVKEQKKDEKVLRRERYSGKAYRSFTLGKSIDSGGAQATYKDGVLELRLPKKEAVMARKITIQ